jgi:hypothetical protein
MLVVTWLKGRLRFLLKNLTWPKKLSWNYADGTEESHDRIACTEQEEMFDDKLIIQSLGKILVG